MCLKTLSYRKKIFFGILIFSLSCTPVNKAKINRVNSNKSSNYQAQNTHYYYQQQNVPASRFYDNPYAIPATNQQYPRYDSDRYYTAPTNYNSQSDLNVIDPARAKSILENLNY